MVVGSVICLDYNGDVVLNHYYIFHNQFLHGASRLINCWCVTDNSYVMQENVLFSGGKKKKIISFI